MVFICMTLELYLIFIYRTIRFVFLPGPDFIVKPSDTLVMIGREDDLTRIQESPSD
jgi:K+/H+ antiporter YhaU regulatory subunit KhtT